MKRLGRVPSRGTLRGTLRVPLKGTLKVPLKGTLKVPLKGTLKVPLKGTLKGTFKGYLKGGLKGYLWGGLRGTLRGGLRGGLRGTLRVPLRLRTFVGGGGWGDKTLRGTLRVPLRYPLRVPSNEGVGPSLAKSTHHDHWPSPASEHVDIFAAAAVSMELVLAINVIMECSSQICYCVWSVVIMGRRCSLFPERLVNGNSPVHADG